MPQCGTGGLDVCHVLKAIAVFHILPRYISENNILIRVAAAAANGREAIDIRHDGKAKLALIAFSSPLLGHRGSEEQITIRLQSVGHVGQGLPRLSAPPPRNPSVDAWVAAAGWLAITD